MTARSLIAALFATTTVAWAVPLPAPTVFDLQALARWRQLDENDVIPYHSEGLGSQLLHGARSPQGSYIFITLIDNTVKRPALTAAELAALILEENYADLQPVSFITGTGSVEVVGDTQLPCVVTSFRTRKLAYEVGSGDREALVKTVFLPIVLYDQNSGAYSNWIYVANFRGNAANKEDLSDYDSMWRRVSVPAQFATMQSQRFNVLQPGLAAQPAGTTYPKSGEAKKAAHSRPPEIDENPSLLATALLARLAGRESEGDQRQLSRFAQIYHGSVLADVLSILAYEHAFELQRDVWREILASTDSSAKARFLALFLARSIALGDWRAAESIAADATDASLSLASLDSADLGLILDSLLRLSEAAPAQSGTQEFFTLRDPTIVQTLRSLLATRGLVVPELDDIAERGRDGAWHPKEQRSLATLPRIASDSGKLFAIGWERTGRKPTLRIVKVANLLQLVNLKAQELER